MSIKQTCYHIYGVLVDPGEQHYYDLEDAIGQCVNDGSVGTFRAGEYDNHMTFLALSWRRVEPGDYVLHPGDRAHAPEEDRNRWNTALRRKAEALNVRVLDGPGWFTIPHRY